MKSLLLKIGRLASRVLRIRFLLPALLLLCLAPRVLLRLVPLPSALFQSPDSGLEYVDRNGLPLREVAGTNDLYGRQVPLSEIPNSLIQAVIAAEDKRFWSHSGVDWRASARAAVSLIRERRIVSGGSTITQQLIKMASPRPRTFRVKIIEAIQAMRLEQVWTKERILSAYLNRLDYGNLRFGCAAAAQYYFRQPMSDLSVAQSAFLAGLPQAPTRLNPHLHFQRAKKRQEWILGQLLGSGFLARSDYERALREPLRLSPPRRVFQAPHFVDLVMRLEPPATPGAPGRRVYTTLDLNMNRVAETILRQQLARLNARQAQNGAVVILENRTGQILAFVGSENYFSPVAGQVNGAWAPRSAGSTLKPFAYLLALEQGATPATVLADVPCEFPTPTGIFSPVNYNHRCLGPVRYRLALANSLNIPAVKVLASVGGPAVLERRLRDCGLTTLNQPPDFYGLGLVIGNAETRLIELANAYACLARLGEYLPYQLVLKSGFEGLKPNPVGMETSAIIPKQRIFDSGAAWLIADMLSDNDARSLSFGLESNLRFDFPVACKTGTSSDFRDNWALGYTPEFTVGVWVGNFDGIPMSQVSGVTGAAPVMHEIFEYLRQHFGVSWYAPPENVVEKWVHPVTGKMMAHSAPEAIRERFLRSSPPPPEDAGDYDSLGRVRLSSEYRNWFASGDNWLANRAVVDATPSGDALRLISPLPGTVIYLDPDLPGSGNRLPLKAEGPNQVEWRSESLECLEENGRTITILQEGRHELTALDLITGKKTTTWIQVKPL